MSCEKHPDKESVANCAVCGKSICEECLIEIAGNSYCKDCVNELVTESILKTNLNDKKETAEIKEEPVEKETEENLDKPKFRSATNVSNILEEEGLIEEETETPNNIAEGISTGEYNEEPQTQETVEIDETPDEDLEAKYEKYLEDLYYDEPEKQETIETPKQTLTGEYIEEPQTQEYQTPNNDIEITGEYIEEPQTLHQEKEDEEDIIIPAHAQKQDDDGLSYEEIRSRILTEDPAEKKFKQDFEEQQRAYERELKSNYLPQDSEYGDESLYYADIINRDAIEEEEEAKKGDGFTKGEIILSIILIILIIIVMSYVIYLFTLSNDYPSYFDAARVLFTNPAQLFENIIG